MHMVFDNMNLVEHRWHIVLKTFNKSHKASLPKSPEAKLVIDLVCAGPLQIF